MDSGIHLIVQYCNDPRPQRQAEYDECLRRNLANPSIAAVHDLSDTKVAVPEEFAAHAKYKHHGLDRWMTYKDALDYAGAHLAAEVVAIANLDVFLDPA